MFKKPLSDLKTSAPLRSLDRRKLQQRVVNAHALTPEIGELLVPDGLLVQKFSTHLDEPGPNQLVAITQYHSHSSALNPANSFRPIPRIGPPLAVGHMTVSSSELRGGGRGSRAGKGNLKAVLVLHARKDHLWEMGSGRRMEVPEPRLVESQEAVEEDDDADEDEEGEPVYQANADPAPAPSTSTSLEPVLAKATLTPEDISSCLRGALLQVLATTLNSAPPSAFPILASMFWTTHVLPARPAYAMGTDGLADAGAIDIKRSTHKSVKVFLKACAKEGLIKLKETRGDVMITGVSPEHQAVEEHRPYKTIGSVDAKREKDEERKRHEKEEEERKKGEIQVTEFWKPLDTTVGLFVTAGKSTEDLYTLTDIQDILNAYIAKTGLVNAQEKQYINVGQDIALSSAVASENKEASELLKREEVLQRVREHMQCWHSMSVNGGEAITKEGPVKPIKVIAKTRQGGKAATLITGFESFLLQADELADELRKVCASSTSVSPLPGKASPDMKVTVKGNHTKAVPAFLMAKGVPQKWITVEGLPKQKQKK
ncbi:hypothetical protein EUX98_g4892 [Antrodiella citrinella]|uniref:Uncharacterized protein n=1 Tax=Antrodiella citrinella TaxID=2447956 RepID=A0A4V3XIJ5_9APHY|nr:hypothetical protein EUX98_g4892 [Antrodiella citrinella]